MSKILNRFDCVAESEFGPATGEIEFVVCNPEFMRADLAEKGALVSIQTQGEGMGTDYPENAGVCLGREAITNLIAWLQAVLDRKPDDEGKGE